MNNNLLPHYNIFNDISISTFWNYVESFLSIGMPFFLIGAALIVVEWIIPLFKEALQKAKSEDSDDSEDDDWY